MRYLITSSAVVLAVAGLSAAQSDPANFSTVLNIGPGQPDGTSIGNNQSIGSDTQLNLFDGGSIGREFDAGLASGTGSNTEVNLFGGSVATRFDAFAGTSVLLDGALTSTNTGFRDGSSLLMRSGVLGFSADFFSGSTAIFEGGLIQSACRFTSGSTAVIAGGRFQSATDIQAGADVTFRGDDFRLDGVPITDLAGGLPDDAVFSGVYESGEPFVFSSYQPEEIAAGSVTLVSVSPAVSTTPAVLSSGIFEQGVRPGESLTITGTGELIEAASIIDASVVVDGGAIGEEVRIARSDIRLVDGVIGGNSEAYDSMIRVEGGLIDFQFEALRSTLIFSGGQIQSESRAEDGSIVTVTGGTFLGEFEVRDGSQFSITSGTIGQEFEVQDSSFRMDGGTLDEGSSFGNAVAIVTAGTLAGDLNIGDSATFHLSGGSLGPDIEVDGDGSLAIYGSNFTLGGGLVPGLVVGAPTTITDRDTILRGNLADGTAFEIDLDDRDVDDDATVTVTAVEAGCQVAHLAIPRTTIEYYDHVELLDRIAGDSSAADFNGDGSIDAADITAALQAATAGCSLPF